MPAALASTPRNERLGIACGCGEDVAAVARAQVKCHVGAVLPRGERADFTDVHFLEAAPSDDS